VRIRHSVDLEAPLAFAYELFWRLEVLPRFLPAVRHVEPDASSEGCFRIEVTGTSRRIPVRVELVDEWRITWRNLEDATEGAIQFEPVTPWVTRLHVAIELQTARVAPHYAELGAHFLALQRYFENLARLRRLSHPACSPEMPPQ